MRATRQETGFTMTHQRGPVLRPPTAERATFTALFSKERRDPLSKMFLFVCFAVRQTISKKGVVKNGLHINWYCTWQKGLFQ